MILCGHSAIGNKQRELFPVNKAALQHVRFGSFWLAALCLLFFCCAAQGKENNALYTGMDYVSLEYGELPTEENALLTIGGNINLTSMANMVFEAGFGNREKSNGVRMRSSVFLQVSPIKRFGFAPYVLAGLSQIELGTQQCGQNGVACESIGVQTIGMNYGMGVSLDVWRGRQLNLSWSRFDGSDDVRLNMFSMGVSFK